MTSTTAPLPARPAWHDGTGEVDDAAILYEREIGQINAQASGSIVDVWLYRRDVMTSGGIVVGDVLVVADEARLTPAQARERAALLTEAADAAE